MPKDDMSQTALRTPIISKSTPEAKSSPDRKKASKARDCWPRRHVPTMLAEGLSENPRNRSEPAARES
jgi:hypothetical protein